MTAFISVCIPAYNRAALLPALLQSAVTQNYDRYEILICEDASPERRAIAEIARSFSAAYPGRIRYIENDLNLGFDGNLRKLIDNAHGAYCLFMGNDDLLAAGALQAVASAIERHPNIGVVVRSYASFDEDPGTISQEFRYFDSERFFPSGTNSIVTVFRRCVVISGITLHCGLAREFSTDALDGTLLYQVYLAARIANRMNSVFVPDIIALYRNGGIPDFGSAESERGKFVPGERTLESSLNFMRGMRQVAQYVQDIESVQIRDAVIRDISHYSYPVLSIQANRPFRIFLNYVRQLQLLGYGCTVMFYVYFSALLVLGPRTTERMIQFIKRRLGHTPRLGRVYSGQAR